MRLRTTPPSTSSPVPLTPSRRSWRPASARRCRRPGRRTMCGAAASCCRMGTPTRGGRRRTPPRARWATGGGVPGRKQRACFCNLVELALDAAEHQPAAMQQPPTVLLVIMRRRRKRRRRGRSHGCHTCSRSSSARSEPSSATAVAAAQTPNHAPCPCCPSPWLLPSSDVHALPPSPPSPLPPLLPLPQAEVQPAGPDRGARAGRPAPAAQALLPGTAQGAGGHAARARRARHLGRCAARCRPPGCCRAQHDCHGLTCENQ